MTEENTSTTTDIEGDGTATAIEETTIQPEPTVAPISAATVTRLIIMLLAIVNMILQRFGINPLDFADADVSELVSDAWLVCSVLWTAWKNNDLSRSARTVS